MTLINLYYLLISFYSFDIDAQIKRVMQSNTFNVPKRSSEFICDIFDGDTYKNFRESINNEMALSFTMNSDGIDFGTSSSLALWPVFLSINEIPLKKRFSFENTIVAGEVFIYIYMFKPCWKSEHSETFLFVYGMIFIIIQT